MDFFVVEHWDDVKVALTVACSDALKVAQMGIVSDALLVA